MLDAINTIIAYVLGNGPTVFYNLWLTGLVGWVGITPGPTMVVKFRKQALWLIAGFVIVHTLLTPLYATVWASFQTAVQLVSSAVNSPIQGEGFHVWLTVVLALVCVLQLALTVYFLGRNRAQYLLPKDFGTGTEEVKPKEISIKVEKSKDSQDPGSAVCVISQSDLQKLIQEILSQELSAQKSEQAPSADVYSTVVASAPIDVPEDPLTTIRQDIQDLTDESILQAGLFTHYLEGILDEVERVSSALSPKEIKVDEFDFIPSKKSAKTSQKPKKEQQKRGNSPSFSESDDSHSSTDEESTDDREESTPSQLDITPRELGSVSQPKWWLPY